MTNLEKGQIRKFLLGRIQSLIKNKQTNKSFIYLHYSPNMQTISKLISFEYFIVISSMRSRFCKYFDSRQVPKKKKKTHRSDGQVPIPLPLDPPPVYNYVSSALRSGLARLPLSFHKVKCVTSYVLSYLQVSGMFCPIKK